VVVSAHARVRATARYYHPAPLTLAWRSCSAPLPWPYDGALRMTEHAGCQPLTPFVPGPHTAHPVVAAAAAAG